VTAEKTEGSAAKLKAVFFDGATSGLPRLPLGANGFRWQAD